MASKDRTRVEQQGELALTRRAEPNTVPIEMIRRQKTGAAAFCLAIQSSGLEDGEIAACLEIDAGYFSRIKKGEASLQCDLIKPFCYLVHNTIYPEWIAYQVGGTVVQIQSEAERELDAERLRRIEAEKKLAWAERVLAGRVTEPA